MVPIVAPPVGRLVRIEARLYATVPTIAHMTISASGPTRPIFCSLVVCSDLHWDSRSLLVLLFAIGSAVFLTEVVGISDLVP